jgi:hypothetical protein
LAIAWATGNGLGRQRSDVQERCAHFGTLETENYVIPKENTID